MCGRRAFKRKKNAVSITGKNALSFDSKEELVQFGRLASEFIQKVKHNDAVCLDNWDNNAGFFSNTQ